MFKEKKFTSKTGLSTNVFDNQMDKPAMMFIHGGRARPLRNYSSFLNDISQDFRIIAPEIPGYVNSYYPDNYMDLKDLGLFFNELLENYGIYDCAVSGHSIGGGIGLLMAAHNNSIKKVVASNSAGYPLNYSKERLALSMLFKTFKQGYSKQGLKVFRKIYSDIMDTSRGTNGGKNSTSFALKGALYAMNRNYSDDLKQIKAQVMIIHAKRDNLFKWHAAQYLRDLIPSSTVYEVRGFHDWPMHEGKEFAKITKEFLKNF